MFFMPKIITTDFNKDFNLGLYGFATEKYIFVGKYIELPKNFEENIKIIKNTVANTNLVGIFCTGNSSGILVSSDIPYIKKELDRIEENVYFINTKYTALGNLLLMNDKGCIISYLIKNLKEKIERFVGLDCQIASKKYMVIGSLAIATNKGCLVSPIFDEDEIKKIEKVLKVKVDVGTANFGSYYVGSCIIANSNFALISPKTTGVEIAKIEEVLLRGG